MGTPPPSPAMPAPASPATGPTSTDGQPLGERGQRTRQRILEAVGAAIQQHGLRGIRLADIARDVGFKPPAFYQYFADLDEAILALCADAGGLLPQFKADADDLEVHAHGSRPFVDEFFRYWNSHRPLLTARHAAILAGDRRFQDAANEAFRPVAETLHARIEGGQRDGAIDPGLHPWALGAVLNAMLEVVAMSAPSIPQYWGASDSTDLAEAVAYVIDRALGTEPPRGSQPA